MNEHERYLRQENSFSHERRMQTFIAELGGECAGLTSPFLKAGAAAAGVARLWSDFHGSGVPGQHWLLGDHDALTSTLNPELDYDYLDPDFLRQDLQDPLASHENAWLVVQANDPAGALEALGQLADLPVPVLLLLAAPGGVVVQRHPRAATALERLAGLAKRQTIPAAPADLAMVAAGAALNEIMLAGRWAVDEMVAPRTILFYSLHRRRRIDLSPETTLAEIADELAARPKRGDFSGRRIKQVGAGALGNWTAIAVALDGHVSMEVIDGDPRVEPHNLNRQILLVHGVGQPKAPVLTRELRLLDPAGTYTELARYLERPEDLEPLDRVDAVIMAPDNDLARLRGAETAWLWGVPYGVGGTGTSGGQLVVQQPGRACYRCITGLNDDKPADQADRSGADSCALAADESIVASNMVIAGLLCSELRVALAGGRSQNLRFFGQGAGDGNRLGRMPGDLECAHQDEAGSKSGTCSLEV